MIMTFLASRCQVHMGTFLNAFVAEALLQDGSLSLATYVDILEEMNSVVSSSQSLGNLNETSHHDPF